MSEQPSDPVMRSVSNVESPATGAPGRRRISWVAILGWSLLLAVVAGGGLMWATGFIRFSSDPLTARRAGKYEAEVVLHVHPVQPRILFEGAPAARDPEPLEAYGRAQAVLARSRLVLSTALKDQKVAALPSVRVPLDPLEWLEDRLEVDFSQGSEFMRFSMRGNDEQELTALLDAIVNAYLNEVVFKEHNKRLARIDQLKDIAAHNQNRVETQKNVLRELQRAAGAADRKTLQVRQELALLYRSNAEKELVELKATMRRERIELQALQAQEKHQASAPIPNAMIEELLAKDPGVIEEQKAVVAIQMQVRDISASTKNDRVLAEGSERLSRARKVLEAKRQEVLPRVKEQALMKLLMNTQDRMADLEGRLAMATALEGVLTADIERFARSQQDINNQGLNVDSIQEQIQQAEEVARKALVEAARMEVERAAPPRVQRLGDGVTIRRVK